MNVRVFYTPEGGVGGASMYSSKVWVSCFILILSRGL